MDSGLRDECTSDQLKPKEGELKKTKLFMCRFRITIPWIATTQNVAYKNAWEHIRKILRDGSESGGWPLDEIPATPPTKGGILNNAWEIKKLSDAIRPWTSRSKVPYGGTIKQEFENRKEKKPAKKKGGEKKK